MSPKSESSKEPILRLIETTLAKLTPEISRFRRHLHRNPELSGEEIETTRFLAQCLDHEKVPHRIAQEGKGIITETFAGMPNAPAIALRADIDALPIQEENGVDYRSAKPGVMHACGHDAHTAILLGTTIALRQAGHNMRLALVMLKLGLTAQAAKAKVERAKGDLRKALGE